MRRLLFAAWVVVAMFSSGCASSKRAKANMTNPATYFEIPVADLDRAVHFYRTVFGYEFTRQAIDGNEMALFPL